jgi:aspartate 1-decarboxylase
MLIEVLKSKIHRATITDANLNYEGSIGIDENLIDAAGLQVNEKVHVLNVNNGERLETYVIKAPRGSGTISLNGAAARKGMKGDIIIIVAYGTLDQAEARNHKPAVVYPDTQNQLP